MPNIWGFADDEEDGVVPASYDPGPSKQGETMWHSPSEWFFDEYDEQYDEEPVRLDDRTIVKETAKAYMCSEGYWWPKSQVERVEDGVLVVTPWIYERKRYETKPPSPPIAETRTLAELIGIKNG